MTRVMIASVVLLLVNAVTLLRFWQDKRRAVAGRRRISERQLLGLALAGGTPGAWLARQLFRHKTRKQPFGRRLRWIAAVQAMGLAGLLIA